MKPVSRHALKHVLRILVIFAGTALMLGGQSLYQYWYSPIKTNEQAVCANEAATGHERSTVRDVALGRHEDKTEVRLYGRISYLPSADAFYLRDGAFNVRLDVSDCRNVKIFKAAETPVFVKGAVYRQDGEPAVEVDGIGTDAPVWVHDVFGAGLYLYFGVIIAVVTAVLAFLGWLLILIGVRQPKPEMPLEKRRTRQAGNSVLAAVAAPVLWFLNPIIGFLYHGAGLYLGWKGLKSPKRTVAIVGLTLCAAGIVAVPILRIALGAAAKPAEPDFYRFLEVENFASSRSASGTLETRRYRNEKSGFSLRLPKGWTIEENAAGGPQVFFYSPKPDEVGGKPFTANINVISGPNEGKTAEELRQLLKTQLESLKGSAVVEEGAIASEDRTIGLTIGLRFPIQGVAVRNLILIAEGGGNLHVLTATALDSTWSLHEQEIRDSLATVRVKT